LRNVNSQYSTFSVFDCSYDNNQMMTCVAGVQNFWRFNVPLV